MKKQYGGNLLSSLPESLPEELEQQLLSSKQVSIKRIVSKGQCSPDAFWYDQSDNEWVLVVQGEAVLAFENDEDLHMKQGAYCLIPAHKKHRVKWTAEDQLTVWLAIHFNDEDLGLESKEGGLR